MFSVKVDDLTLWSPVDNDLKLVSPVLNLEVNKVGSFSFKIYPQHIYYGRLTKMKSIISVYQDNRTLFKGRIFSDEIDFHKAKKVEVEGVLGFLNDSRVRPYSFKGSVKDYFTSLIAQHNDQVEEFQRFKVGVVTVEDPNDYIIRESSNTPKTWDEINDKLIKLLGGYVSIRYEEDGNYVDYLSNYSDTSTQKIAFAVNLLDLEQLTKGDSLATCIIPYGAKDESTGKPIDIKSVNDGVDYVYDADAVARFGKIFEVKTWDDVTLPKNLLSKARLYLSERIRFLSAITIKAVDLHLTNETIEAFKLGDYIEVDSSPHGIDETILLTAYKMDLTNPAGATITLGLERSSFLDDQAGANRDGINRIDIIRKDIGDMVTIEINGIELGTRNYLQKTDVAKYADQWHTWYCTKSLQDDGFLRITPNQGKNRAGVYPPQGATLKAGEKYTLSFDAYADANTIMDYFYIVHGDNGEAKIDNIAIDITTTPKRYVHTFEVSQDYINASIVIGSHMSETDPRIVCVKDLKLEQGNKATSWTPAPEDFTTELSGYRQETYTYINESIENSEEATRTMLREYAVKSDVEDLREEVSTQFTQTAEDFNFQFDTVNERITTENGEIVRILEENSKYIRLVDGNIVLGEKGAALTTKIANGRISFLYNDTVEVAYISEQKLYITHAEILDSIIIGNFGYFPRTNGNLSFKKI